MKKYIFMVVAAIAALSSCSNDNDPIMDETGITTNSALATTGSAAIKGGGTVGWVQLWAGGPKFAEKNVGANGLNDAGYVIDFTDAVKEGEEYVWGENWCTPSQDDLDHLVTAASNGQTDDKVTCEYTYVSGAYGFKFTGKEEGYKGNSVFFPAHEGNSRRGHDLFWSGTASGNKASGFNLGYTDGFWFTYWFKAPKGMTCYVRPVLKN